MGNDYTPISCAFYDELESAAVKRVINDIIYMDEDIQKKVSSRIIDFKTINKEEFMILENRQIIRLDKIKLINGISPGDKQYC